MSGTSAIEWTEATWNPTTGCDRISPGCAHCYAKELHDRRHKAVLAGKTMPLQFEVPFETVQLRMDRLGTPQHWRRPRRIFVDSMSDLFHEDVPDDFIAEVWKTMATIRRHTYQVLTKRAERLQALMPRLVATFGVLPNVWLGTSVENQRFADARIPLLLQTPAAVRFISAEPLLGPLQLAWEGYGPYEFGYLRGGIQWVIAGSESGHGARAMKDDWVRSLRDQCVACGVAFFFKQRSTVSGKKIGMPLLDGKVWNEFPKGVSVESHA